MQDVELIVRRGLWDNKPRLLLLTDSFLQFDDQDFAKSTSTHLLKSDIVGFRYGIKWIRGFEMTIGREYQIYLLNTQNKVLKIHFKSFYGFRRQECHDLFKKIIDGLWDFYFTDVSNQYLEDFENGKSIQINPLNINQDGIEFGDKNLVVWEDVATQDYQTYFAIYSNQNPSKINFTSSYLDDWNTAVIYAVVRTILENRKQLK